jgi:hypothetical protein
MGNALHAVGQMLAGLGRRDPCLQPSGKLEFHLGCLLAGYNRQDPPPSQVKPIPLPILQHNCTMNHWAHHPWTSAIADMLILGFFFLLCPGEYAQTTNPDSSPFRLCDLHLMVGTRCLHHPACSEQELDAVNFIVLEFTHQKNGVCGEIIGLGRSGNPFFCPVTTALVNRVKHLRDHRAAPTMP